MEGRVYAKATKSTYLTSKLLLNNFLNCLKIKYLVFLRIRKKWHMSWACKYFAFFSTVSLPQNS